MCLDEFHMFISPFPLFHSLSLSSAQLAPALATGNASLLKPSPLTPLTAIEFARLCTRVGIPSGLVNILPGDEKVLWMSRSGVALEVIFLFDQHDRIYLLRAIM